MDNPCKDCHEADAAQPAGAFEPRCDSGCRRFSDYTDYVGKELDQMITAYETVIRIHNGGK